MRLRKAVPWLPALAGRQRTRSPAPTAPPGQGGTCIVLGDELSKLEEAGRLAAEVLGCRLHRTEPYYNETGHSQARRLAAPCRLAARRWEGAGAGAYAPKPCMTARLMRGRRGAGRVQRAAAGRAVHGHAAAAGGH